jgi:nucleotide-binding universal stress UspA family protein
MYRTLLVHVDLQQGSTERIRLAADLARQFEAKLIGLTAALARPPVEAMSAGVMDASLIELERNEIRAEFVKAEQTFKAVTAEVPVEAEWRALETFPVIAMADSASAADLVIVGRTARHADGDYKTINVGELLIRAGRPVLVAPPGIASLAARSVMVAWKNTRESRRAISDALPLLKRAEQVTVVEVREGKEASSVADIGTFLSAHGINFRAEVIERDGSKVEDQLSSFAERIAADLVVAGGYGHSRIRELVFGGVTRRLITWFAVPCLLSH